MPTIEWPNGKIRPEDYRVDDIFHLIRYMCPNCGYVMDSEFGSEEGRPGSPLAVYHGYGGWEDDDGWHEDGYEELLCPRCHLDLSESQMIPVMVERYTDIRKLIEQGEKETLEFKGDFPCKEDLAKWIASFASTKGGRIVLGVDKRYQPVGLKAPYTDSPEGKEAFRQYIRTQVLTQIKPSVNPIVVDLIPDKDSGKTVGVVIIQRGSRPPYWYHDKAYIRVCEGSRPATPEEVEEMIQSRPKGVQS